MTTTTTKIKKQPPTEEELIQEKARFVLDKVEESEEGDLGRAYSEWCEIHYEPLQLAEFHDTDNVQEPFDKAQEMFIGIFDDLETALKADISQRLLHDTAIYLIDYLDWERLVADVRKQNEYIRFDVYWFRV